MQYNCVSIPAYSEPLLFLTYSCLSLLTVSPSLLAEDLSASIRKMGGSIHHYILQLQESEEPNAVLSARADLVRLRGAEILRRVLQGLDYMHQQNVVHRDIKGVKDLSLFVYACTDG